MMKKPIFAVIVVAAALGSCAKDGESTERKKSVSIGRFGVRHNTVPGAPEGVAVKETTTTTSAAKPTVRSTPAEPKPAAGEVKADGLRLPNMLGMPEEKDLKATNPTVPKSGEDGAVISRPPVEKKE